MSTLIRNQSENEHNSHVFKKSNSLNKLNLIKNMSEDPFIVHPGAISSILQLLPAVPTIENDQVDFLPSKFIDFH